MAASALNPQQQQVLGAILRIGRRRRVTPKEIKAAVETGLVESNLTNVRHGDADSLGWRQERASLYKNPLNLKASINRFYDETGAVRGKYGTAGALAAAVQRPGAQYRGRYQQHAGEASQLIRSLGGGGIAGTSGAGFTPARVDLGQKNVFDQAGFEQAKRAALVGGLIARRHGTDSILFRSGLLTTSAPSESDFMSSTMTSKLIPGHAGHVVTKPRGGGVHIRGPLFELFWQGAKGIDVKNGQLEPQGFVSGHTDHVHVAAGRTTIVELGRLAKRLGLRVGENPHFGGVHPVHVEGSYHYRDQAIDVSGDPGLMAAYAHRVARLFGIGR